MSVQRETMSEELEEERPWEAHAWLRAETLAAMAELNEQCLEMLALQFAATERASVASAGAGVGPLLRGMDPDARHRAAACPYLLFDAGFADQQRWAWVSGRHVSELQRKEPPYFTFAADPFDGARGVHLRVASGAQSERCGAVAAGDVRACRAAHCRVHAAKQIHDLAETHPEWLLPRWATRPASGASC